MILYSTADRTTTATFREAVTSGIAADGGLFLPARIPSLGAAELAGFRRHDIREIALRVLAPLLTGEIQERDLETIVSRAFTFPAPLHPLGPGLDVLELFHGPTLAFKDFGARFLAHTMNHLDGGGRRERTVLVATSGDTGSAVAHGFAGVAGVRVVLLYPSGKVSRIQEQQLTTVGGNVAALEIDGTFDDCQRLVKQAFAHRDLNARCRLTSANSINIGRLLPQMVYYFCAWAQSTDDSLPLVFSVPSGNLGNLTAGLLAARMGLPVERFVAATNVNDVFRRYLASGVFTPERAVPTLSNAMDVGDPGNLARIRSLAGDDVKAIRRTVVATTFNDAATREGISSTFRETGYILDPHTSVASLALKEYRSAGRTPFHGIILGTAHPAKFPEAYGPEIRDALETPERLARMLQGTKVSIRLAARFDELADYLASIR